MSRARKLVEGALKKLDEASATHLEIVGVSPADAYSAQVTHDRPFDLMGRTSAKRGVRRTGGGPDLPYADGKPRQRMAGGPPPRDRVPRHARLRRGPRAPSTPTPRTSSRCT